MFITQCPIRFLHVSWHISLQDQRMIMRRKHKIKVLVLTNMRPSPQKPYSGIFVVNQYKRLQEDPAFDISVYDMERTFTGVFGSVIKYCRAFALFTPHLFRHYQLIHLHYFFPLILPVSLYKLMHKRSRVVVTFHGSDINERINWLNKVFFRYLTNSIDYTISVGKDLSKMIEEKLKLKSDLILSAGVDERVFKPLKGIEKKYHFIYASSFVTRKGLDIYLTAINNLGRRDLKFCFVGSGILESEVRKLTKEFDIDIRLNLTQSEMCQAFNESFFHVLPSRFEPFGLVVTESMFCGTPSIVSNVGGIKDQVVNDSTGFVLQELTSNHLMEEMKKCLGIIHHGLYTQMSQKCLNSNKHHSLQNVVSRTMDIYRDLTCRDRI